MNILHITAHLGGGAGKAISGTALQGQRQFGDTHRILLLQEPEKSGYVQACRDGGVGTAVWSGDKSQLDWADVIAVSWWNHPTMAQFLHDLPPLSTPLVLWSHVNGCHYPYLPFRLAEQFDEVLFTSPFSLENPSWTDTERLQIRERAQIVYGMGQFSAEQFVPKEDYTNGKDFVIGYVGTLNYGKLHPEFAAYCQAVCEKIPSARFVMAGDRDLCLEHDIQSAGLADRFSFPGFVSNVPALMRSFDVFGYLLNPTHYGTTENVLLEAMACGVPVVARRQNVEQYIVPARAGYLVENARQYAEVLSQLYHDPARREQLGRQGRAYVQTAYRAETNADTFYNACRSAMRRSDGRHDFSCMGESPWEWFLFCAGKNRRLFETVKAQCSSEEGRELLSACPPVFREERKSSLRHFAAIYPEDVPLSMLSKMMEVSMQTVWLNQNHFYQNKRVLVTGHTGFKGSWLCVLLTMLGAEVTGFALPPAGEENLFTLAGVEDRVRSVSGDIRDLDALSAAFDAARPEIVLHLAAQPIVREGYRDPIGTYHTNVMGTVHILDCVRRSGCVRSFLNVTTDKVYQNNQWPWGYREADRLGGFDPYASSKSCSELVTGSYRRSFLADGGTAVSTARAGNVIGGGDFAPDRILPDCVRAARAGRTIQLRNPASIRPYQHVLEPLSAYLLIAQKQYEDGHLAGCYNVGPESCDCVSTAELADLFCQAWGGGASWEHIGDDGPHEDAVLRLDCSHIRAALGWKPRWHVDRAVAETAAWTKAWLAGKDVPAFMEEQIRRFFDGESTVKER